MSASNLTPRGTAPSLQLRGAVRLWQTPTTSESEGSGFRSGDRSGEPKLAGQARMWGTPVANDAGNSPANHMAQKAKIGDGATRTQPTSLTVQVKMWPTPRASMNENRTGKPAPSHGVTHGRTLAGEASTHGLHDPTTATDGNDGPPRADLNPRFVAALMGVPWDWLNPSTSVETASYQRWLLTHSCNSQNDWK
jgi:hypothetical protein